MVSARFASRRLQSPSLLVLAVAMAFACGKLRQPNKPGGPASEPGAAGESMGGAGMDGSTGGTSNAGRGGRAAATTAGRPGTAGRAGVSSGGAGFGGSVATAGTSSKAGTPSVGGEPNVGAGGTGNGGTGVLDGVEPVESVPGSTPGCPEGPVIPAGTCGPDGLSCGYIFGQPDDDGIVLLSYEECACRRADASGGLAWDCPSPYGTSSSAEWLCPLTRPQRGADCQGYVGLSCPYPTRIECICSSDTRVWDCPAAVPPDLPKPPASIPSDTPVVDLSSSERLAWCSWWAEVIQADPGSPAWPNLATDANGITVGNSCFNGIPEYCDGRLPGLSVEQCVGNLALSACEAPVGLMTACARMVYDHRYCGPFDYECYDYFASPGCSGTAVLEFVNHGSVCGLKVE